MKVALFKQPCGLGDILFCQKLIGFVHSLGFDKTIWPVTKAYSYLGEYIDNGYNTEFPCVEDEFLYKNEYNNATRAAVTEYTPNLTVICTDGCNDETGVMHAKYNLIQKYYNKLIDCSDWQHCFKIKRNIEKERSLCEVLNLSIDELYVLVNKHIGTPPNHLSYWNHIDTDTPLKKVYLGFVPGYTIFDWCTVVENAQEIHMEGSALTYIIEQLNIKASVLKLYSRNHEAIKGIFKTNWQKT